jgi:hypothetical protein
MYDTLEHIALTEFADIVTGVRHISRRAGVTLKLRLDIRDGTFVDVRLNPLGTRYAYHWEQRAQRGQLHRHNNAPDHPHVTTHPKHFHNGSESNVKASHIPDAPADALRYFLNFVRDELAALGL